MAYSYAYPYMSQNGAYNGMNNFQPMSNVNSQNQQALNPFYQMTYPINNQRFSAFFVNDYSEVKNATVSADGSPALFMMNDKDVFYIKKVGEDGRTILKSYTFTEYTENDIVDVAQSNTEIESLKTEVGQIKETLNDLIKALTPSQQVENKGGNNNDTKYNASNF